MRPQEGREHRIPVSAVGVGESDESVVPVMNPLQKSDGIIILWYLIPKQRPPPPFPSLTWEHIDAMGMKAALVPDVETSAD